jgi:trigger factor
MQVSVEKASALERRLTIQVPGDQLQQKIDARLREIGKQVKIKGFRPGRIPFKVLQQRYGKSVQQEIVAQEVQTSLAEALEKESLRPASSPVLESAPDLQPGGDLEYTASIEVFPEIEDLGLDSCDIVKPVSEVTAADIDEMVRTLQTQRQTWRDLEKPGVEGNQVIVEYTAEIESGRVPKKGKQRIAITLGDSGFEELESAVAKLGPGQESSTSLTFPEGYRDGQLAGQKADVELTVVKVQEAELPEVDEDFIRSFGVESGSLEDLQAEVRGNLERELKQASTTYLKLQLIDQLLAAHADLEVPEALVRDEAAGLQRQAAARAGVEPDEANLEPFMNMARNRVKSGLLLSEIARRKNIVIDGARVRQAIETVAETYEQPQEVIRLYYGDERLLKSVENAVLEEQVVDWVVDNAKVSEKAMSFNDVISAAAQGGKAA